MPGLRRLLRQYLPEELRAALAQARRAAGDRLSGDRLRFAARRLAAEVDDWPEALALVQPIRQTAFWEGKLHNLQLGAARLDGTVIAPGEIFSFWGLIGRPDAASGFAHGRSIRADAVGADIGGGLCQLSGLAYELGLRAALTLRERHPHSRDLYAEEARFAPLGLDATVVWPWKDLRLGNPHPFPVALRCAVRGMALHAAIHAPQPLPNCELTIERQDAGDQRRVSVSRQAPGGAPERVSNDLYIVDQAASS